jgi:RNA polymerase sigma-70 factor (ECF subfamily)
MILIKTQQEFQSLYAQHSPSVQRFLLSMVGGNTQTAQELTQDAFLKAWKSLPSFAFKSSLKTWVFSVALNTARDWLRSHANTSLITEEEIQGEEQSDKLTTRAMILKLKEESRVMIILHYYEEMKISEIAEVTKIPQGTVKSRLFTAKQELKDLLIEQGFEL